MIETGQIREYKYSRGALQIIILERKTGYFNEYNQEIKFWITKDLKTGNISDLEERIILKNTILIGE